MNCMKLETGDGQQRSFRNERIAQSLIPHISCGASENTNRTFSERFAIKTKKNSN